MFLSDLLFAVVIAVFFTAIFVVGLGQRGPWESLLFFFLVVFLATWAGGIWIAPFGPTLFGVYWVPFMLAGLLFALVLAVGAPQPRPRAPAAGEVREGSIAVGALEVLFWVLVAAFIVAIFTRYL